MHYDKIILSISVGTLGFYLNGVSYPNGSTVLRTDIGEGADALQCTTDSTTCCTNVPPEVRAGEFYMPDGGIVLPVGSTTNGYYRNRGSQLIRLHRQSSGTITGQFRCNIPQRNGLLSDLFINIGEYKTYFSIIIIVHSCNYTMSCIPNLQLIYLSPSLLLVVYIVLRLLVMATA